MTLFSSSELIAMGRHIPTPFSISVDTEQGTVELKIDSLLRTVPGKRLVALSTWQNRAVIVKIFISSNRWKRGMLKDITGINRLKQAHIPSPNLLMQTTTSDKKAGVLVIEYLRQGTSLATLFDEAKSEAARAEILEMGVKAVADCHRAGLWQNDIHLDNFMLCADIVYVLDGADIKSKGNALDTDTRLANFAMFLAQFPVSQDEHWRALFDQYSKQAPGPTIDDASDFAENIIRARRKRLKVYERKLTRSTSANRCEQGAKFFYIYDRSIHSLELDRFIADPDSFINEQQLLKDGNSSTVAMIKINGHNYVLKRYNIKGFWHGISRAFRPSRAHHSWRNASVLEMLGVATAHPFLCLEERVFWLLRKRAYFLCEYIEGHDLGTAWEKQELETRENEIVALFRGLFKVMADYRISHGDMKATNFLLQDKELVVLDLDAMVRNRSRTSFVEKFSKDLKRFRKNWVGTSMEPEIEALLTDAAKF
jgi:tRNA A-37 threonylcarbamoyl transferase component Bud32